MSNNGEVRLSEEERAMIVDFAPFPVRADEWRLVFEAVERILAARIDATLVGARPLIAAKTRAEDVRVLRETCLHCFRPHATQADWERCDDDEGIDLCWARLEGPRCDAVPVRDLADLLESATSIL